MRSARNIENLIKNLDLDIDTNTKMDRAILGELFEAQENSKKTKSALIVPEIWRTVMKSRITKLTAAAVIIVAMLIGIYLFGGSIDGTSLAWADVVRQMQQIRTATWTETGEASPPKIEGAIRTAGNHIRQCAYKAPGRERQDTTQTFIDPRTEKPAEFKFIHIIDRNAGKALLLNPQEMTAALCSFDPSLPQNPLYDVFFNPPEKMPSDAQSLGTKQLGDREAIGFRLLKKNDGTYPWSGDITDIWVDAKTRLLVMVETKAADGGWGFRLTDFVFDQDLDDSLFSLEPPPGYTQTAPPQIRSTTTREEGK